MVNTVNSRTIKYSNNNAISLIINQYSQVQKLDNLYVFWYNFHILRKDNLSSKLQRTRLTIGQYIRLIHFQNKCISTNLYQFVCHEESQPKQIVTHNVLNGRVHKPDTFISSSPYGERTCGLVILG